MKKRNTLLILSRKLINIEDNEKNEEKKIL